jgi:hypothetical protein
VYVPPKVQVILTEPDQLEVTGVPGTQDSVVLKVPVPGLAPGGPTYVQVLPAVNATEELVARTVPKAFNATATTVCGPFQVKNVFQVKE